MARWLDGLRPTIAEIRLAHYLLPWSSMRETRSFQCQHVCCMFEILSQILYWIFPFNFLSGVNDSIWICKGAILERIATVA